MHRRDSEGCACAGRGRADRVTFASVTKAIGIRVLLDRSAFIRIFNSFSQLVGSESEESMPSVRLGELEGVPSDVAPHEGERGSAAATGAVEERAAPAESAAAGSGAGKRRLP